MRDSNGIFYFCTMIEILESAHFDIPLKDRKELHEILRIAYALTEVEVWGENYLRITFEDYNKLIDKGEILIAYHEGNVVGGIHFYQRKPGLYSFSLLCADFDKSGLGIGRLLVERVEELALKNNATSIQLEILRPKGIDVPFKLRISSWYERMGYRYTHSQNFAEVVPVKAVNLVNPSDFDYYTKELV